MNTIRLTPEKGQKSMWIFGWIIQFILFVALDLVLIFILEYPANLILGIIISLWLVIMLLILVWIPAYYNSLEYSINSDSIIGKKGVFWKKTVTIPYFKITNIDITQGPVQRMFNLGTIHCQTAGAAGPQGQKAELKLVGISDLEGVKETIREKIKGFVKNRDE